MCDEVHFFSIFERGTLAEQRWGDEHKKVAGSIPRDTQVYWRP